MASGKQEELYSDEEATRRMNEALRRALTTPPKPHAEMKVGKPKPKAKASPTKQIRKREKPGR
jgi:hypothetical protein